MIERRFDRRFAILGVVLFLVVAHGAIATGEPLPETSVLAEWIEEFKTSPKGPFERIRWFCKDGTVQPPKAYACANHGGGIQHGELNERAARMRAGGYRIANLLADANVRDYSGSHENLGNLKQLLLERFLIDWDDGWIYRGARTYRGAFQSEDEEAGALQLAQALWDAPSFRKPANFMLYREVVRLLPLQGDEGSATHVRVLAKQIADKDKGFQNLRAKIHGMPDAGDAAKVRSYAESNGKKNLQGDYAELATSIDDLYSGAGAADLAIQLSEVTGTTSLPSALSDLGNRLKSEKNPSMRIALAGRLSGLLRKHIGSVNDPKTAVDLMLLSLALEDDVYTVGNGVLRTLDSMTRDERLKLLDYSAEALYGAGFIGTRHLVGVKDSLARLRKRDPATLTTYREELRYLSRASEWAGRWLEFNFGEQVHLLTPIEPLTIMYTQDRLRGSPLLVYSRVIDSLVLDSNRLSGIQHELFGKSLGAGLRALNPGLARGVIKTAADDATQEDFDRDGIYMLSETIADLPPVAGILTKGEGSSLSHVQLLARNLGIPNVVVGEELLPVLEQKINQPTVIAVSPNGVVMMADDGPRWDPVFGKEAAEGTEIVIRPDLEKLDIESAEFIPLSNLRATDSGKVSGPKGANLGELKHYFGARVPDGFVIPFGEFRRLLEQPIEPGGPSAWNWMKGQYDEIARIKDPDAQQERANVFLARLRDWIVKADPGAEFHSKLRTALQEAYAQDGEQGVFLRSDTNVEDLAGFVGAGLNLTVPNVVGYDKIVTAIHRVWASPFTERAYKWRQSHMTDPEYVFPAVVVQIGFPSEKSGVMVTTDIEHGEPGWLSVAVNEGVGGAVEGQATESLRIREKNGETRYLAQATTPERVELSKAGGVIHVPASGAETLLKKDEIKQLINFAGEVRKRFVTLRDGEGNPTPADVEFAFKDGKLHLLQIRSFVESKGAQSSSYLASLDSGLREGDQVQVSLDGVPASGR